MPMENKFIKIIKSGRGRDIFSNSSLVCYSFSSEGDVWETLINYEEWRLQINKKSGVCRIIESSIVRKVFTSLKSVEELINKKIN